MAQKRSNDALVKGEDENCPRKQLTVGFCLRDRLSVVTISAGDDTGGNDAETAGVSDDTGCVGTPQKQKRTAAKSASKSSSGCWLVREKEVYNPFNYRCTKADGLKGHRQELKQYAPEEDQRRFVLDVINAKPVSIPPAALERKERRIRERTSGSTGSWISFKAAADVDGEDMVKEWITNKTVKTRFNPKLTKDMQIKWPFFLEILKETEVWSDLDKLETEQVKTETTEKTEGFKSDFDGRWNGMAVGKSSSASVAEEARADPLPPPLPDDRDKVAMMHLQKAHSLWDKTKRSWEGTLEVEQRIPTPTVAASRRS